MTAPVTIVIPFLNEAAALPLLFEGLEKQTLLPGELIFVDAGSGDGSPELIKDWWKLNRWSEAECCIMLRAGAFPGAARNAGIEAARKEWIAFLDAGVVPEPGWLASLLNFVKDKRVQGVFGVCQFTGEGVIGRAACALSYGYKAVRPVLPASLFHRDVFKQAGLFNPGIRSAEDILWLNRYLKIYSPREICQDAVVRYYKFPNSISKLLGKWYIYGMNTVKAGVLKKQQFVYFFTVVIIAACFIYGSLSGFLMLAVYAVARGVIAPVRKSSSWYWWKRSPVSFIFAIFLGILLDAAKSAGFMAGYVKGLIRR